MQTSLAETYFIDHGNLAIQSWVDERLKGESDVEKAISLYLAVRDEIRYDPFSISFEREWLQASSLIESGKGHCIAKAIFLAASLRCAGIPSRVGLAKVLNHMGAEEFERILRTNVLVPHGYTEVFLDDKWVKCTPAFNRTLCEFLGVTPLEFDGQQDSIFQEYDRSGADFMEYVEDYGGFDDVPFDLILELFQKEYPHLFDEDGNPDLTTLTRR